jgi:DNA-binding NtrC family response regulator/tetratricopeptide (TPR) repeat protein
MKLVADRFALHDDGRAFDLATGARVTLTIGNTGNVAEQVRWAEHCAALCGVRHHASAPLVDFGLCAESSRFEAWGRGYPAREGKAPGELQMADYGLRILETPAVAALAEMFRPAGSSRPHVSAIWGPPGSGKRTLVGELARIARANGFVPLAARLIGSRRSELWRGRSLFVIADIAGEKAWLAFLYEVLAGAVPHVLLLVGEKERRSVSGIAMPRLPVDSLVSAIEPAPLSARLEPIVRRAAERSGGRPGRFARLLWPDWSDAVAAPRSTRRAGLPRVAEQTAVYGGADVLDTVLDAAPIPCEWPAPGELAALRRRTERAKADLARGRHIPGTRQLRQVVGGLVRRGAWSDAAGGALALAGALLRRGRTRDAQSAIAEGRDYASRAEEPGTLADLAVLSGETWIDLGRLDEADSVLGAALSASRAAQDPERIAAASLALARGSYWRGAFADAGALVSAAPAVPALLVRRGLLESRIALGLGDVNQAMSLLRRVPVGPAGVDAVAGAAIAYVTALVHFAAGDLGAAERDLSETLVLARAAHDPQRAIRARLLRAEIERGRERPESALAQLQRLGRVMAAAPPIVRARWELAKALSMPGSVAREVISRQARATGVGAFALYLAARPPFGTSRAGADSADPFADELVAILRVCQTAADESELLKAVCARLRQHLHAATVAFVSVRGDRLDIVAADGSRLDSGIAGRAASAGVTIAPHRFQDRIEAAAPIAYGGEPIGALCARWTIGSTCDTSRAASVLTMSAAAAAPMLAAVAVRQAQAAAGDGDLLGVSGAMAALRQSLARAAAAPFAVLIDGESGSGKELVARAIHRGSVRRQKPFCTLNCAALPEDLVEAELFGHTRGAFTGAVADRAGVFEEAHGGTLFLDEIGELTPRAQAKVLRVIQDGELRRVGENVTRRVDVRIVSATNRALKQEVDAGRFRLDLLYRLDVVHLAVPPLRERREDIPVLAEHFWRDAAQRGGSRATLGAATIAALARYDWPGNVRELQNVLAALAVRTPKRGVVPASALPPCFAEQVASESWSLEQARRTFELRFVRAALVRSGGHRGRAAAELGVTRQGLTKLMTRLGIGN